MGDKPPKSAQEKMSEQLLLLLKVQAICEAGEGQCERIRDNPRLYEKTGEGSFSSFDLADCTRAFDETTKEELPKVNPKEQNYRTTLTLVKPMLAKIGIDNTDKFAAKLAENNGAEALANVEERVKARFSVVFLNQALINGREAYRNTRSSDEDKHERFYTNYLNKTENALNKALVVLRNDKGEVPEIKTIVTPPEQKRNPEGFRPVSDTKTPGFLYGDRTGIFVKGDTVLEAGVYRSNLRELLQMEAIFEVGRKYRKNVIPKTVQVVTKEGVRWDVDNSWVADSEYKKNANEVLRKVAIPEEWRAPITEANKQELIDLIEEKRKNLLPSFKEIGFPDEFRPTNFNEGALKNYFDKIIEREAQHNCARYYDCQHQAMVAANKNRKTPLFSDEELRNAESARDLSAARQIGKTSGEHQQKNPPADTEKGQNPRPQRTKGGKKNGGRNAMNHPPGFGSPTAEGILEPKQFLARVMNYLDERKDLVAKGDNVSEHNRIPIIPGKPGGKGSPNLS